jgi:transcriptional regulator with XRE-family HTH domain
MAFADRLTLELERRGITQRELARRLDVSPQAVNGWIKGAGQPSWRRLVKIEDVLDVPRGELMALLGYRPPADGDEDRLVTLEDAIRADEGISPESKRALLRFVKLARSEAADEASVGE